MKSSVLYIMLLFMFFPVYGFASGRQVQTVAPDTGPAKAFKVFEAWTYADTPDLSSLGFSKVLLFYESSLTTQMKNSNVRGYSASKIERAADIAKKTPDALVVLDIESWGAGQAATKKYVAAIKQFKKANPSSTVGMFGYVPYASYLAYQYFTSGDSAKLRRWEHLQKDTLPIAKAVDVFMPGLYTGGPGLKAWEKAARVVVAKARSIDPNKPVYAFIWPQYAGNPMDPKKNTNRNALRFLPAKMWMGELDTLYSIADGVIIWSGYKDANGKIIKFRRDMPWFVATVKFMKAHGIH